MNLFAVAPSPCYVSGATIVLGGYANAAVAVSSGVAHAIAFDPEPLYAWGANLAPYGYANTGSNAAVIPSRGHAWMRFLTSAGVFGGTGTDAVVLDQLDGWLTDTPTTAVAIGGLYNTTAQVGTRIHYIDYVSGQDGTKGSGGQGSAWSYLGTDTTLPDFYLWDGTNILDSAGRTAPAEGPSSGVPYGTDPENPSGPVKPFKTYGFCGLRGGTGQPGVQASLVTGRILSTASYPRANKPDWWLFKRGVTHDYGVDMLAWQLYYNGATTTSMCISGGNPPVGSIQLIGAWGGPTVERPLIRQAASPFFYRNATTGDFTFGRVKLKSLHFDGSDRSLRVGGAGTTITVSDGDSGNGEFLMEDCWVDQNGQIDYESDVPFRQFRCIVTDAFDTGGTSAQGLFFADKSARHVGTASTLTGTLNVTECVYARNGYTINPNITWPPSANNSRTRNLYLTGDIDQSATSLSDNILLYGASSDQLRCGGAFERNFIYSGSMSLGGHGQAGHTTNTCVDNVLLVYKLEAGITGSGQPMWGYNLIWGANGSITGNILTNAAWGGASIMSQGLFIEGKGGNPADVTDGQTAGMTISGNIFDCASATTGVLTTNGGYYAMQFSPLPNLGANTIDGNIFIKNTGSGSLLRNSTTWAGWWQDQTANSTSRYTADDSVSLTNHNSIISPAVVDTTKSQNWVMTCTSAGPPAVFSVVGYNKSPGTTLGAQANATEGSPYSNAYFSYSNLSNQGVPFSVGNIICWVINEAGYADPTVVGTNTTYANVAAAAFGEGYPDTSRSLKTYLQSLGHVVTSADGYTEAIALLKTCRKGSWSTTLTAKAINNYIREGWGMSALP